MEILALSLIFVLFFGSSSRYFLSMTVCSCVALGTRNAIVNESDKVPVIIRSELVLAGILRMGQEYGGDGCYWWKEGRRKEHCSVFTDFTFLALLTSLWFGNHRARNFSPSSWHLMTSKPVPHSPHSLLLPQDTCPEMQLSSGGKRYTLLTQHSHVWKISCPSESEDNFVLLFQL